MAIGRELSFGVNSTNKANLQSYAKSAANQILMLLIMKPGFIPSLPHLGIDIGKYIYEVSNTLTTNELKDVIYNQCNDLLGLLVSDEMNVFTETMDDGSSVLVIYLPLMVDGEVIDNALYAFSQDKSEKLEYKYSLESELNFK